MYTENKFKNEKLIYWNILGKAKFLVIVMNTKYIDRTEIRPVAGDFSCFWVDNSELEKI